MKAGIVALALLSIIGLMMVFATDSSAVVCPPPKGYKSIGATCYFVNGVIVDTTLMFTGNLNRNPKSFRAEITPIPREGESLPVGILFCGNKGGNQAPGQRIITFTDQLFCDVPVQSTDVDSPANGGTAEHVLCDANISKLTEDQLAFLDSNCSNGQFAIDYVPCAFDSLVKYRSDKDGTIIEQALHRCNLPSCETLGWDNKAGLPEFRQFECEGPID